MNESNNDTKRPKTKVRNKYSRVLIEYINANPQGVHFSEVQEKTKIPDSTLARTLTVLAGSGEIVKAGKKYYPVGANFAIPTFSAIMHALGEETKSIEKEKNHAASARVKIALNELLGVPGHPSPYLYFSLPDNKDILIMEEFLEAIIDRKVQNLNDYLPDLARFVHACFTFRVNAKMEIPRALSAKMRDVEKQLFENDEILSMLDRGEIGNDAWLEIYLTLCDLNDRQIADILNRIVEHAENADDEALGKIKIVMRNNLWCPCLKDLLYNRQFEFFNRQLEKSSKPALAAFYSDIRKYAIKSGTP
jgi:DNA-binding HxlR family transcriptional regulator